MTGPRKVIIQVFLNIVDNMSVNRFVIGFQLMNAVVASSNNLLARRPTIDQLQLLWNAAISLDF